MSITNLLARKGENVDYIDRLTMARIDADDTQRALGAKIGFAAPQIARYETRKNDPPIRYLIAICKEYGLSSDYILGLPKQSKHPR